MGIKEKPLSIGCLILPFYGTNIKSWPPIMQKLLLTWLGKFHFSYAKQYFLIIQKIIHFNIF